MWIYRNLAEWKDLNATVVAREWVNGETFLYLGKVYRLSLISGQDCTLKLKEVRFSLSRELIEKGGTQAARDAFETLYTDKCQQRFTKRVGHYAPKVGVKVGQIRVKDMGYRWASCGSSGTLNFPLMGASPGTIKWPKRPDYASTTRMRTVKPGLFTTGI